MVQSRDVDIEGLFEVIRKARLSSDNPVASTNGETQNVFREPVSPERMLYSNLRESDEHPFV